MTIGIQIACQFKAIQMEKGEIDINLFLVFQ